MTVKDAINRVINEYNIDEITIFKNYKTVYNTEKPKEYSGAIYDDSETKYVEVFNFRELFIFI